MKYFSQALWLYLIDALVVSLAGTWDIVEMISPSTLMYVSRVQSQKAIVFLSSQASILVIACKLYFSYWSSIRDIVFSAQKDVTSYLMK